MVRVFWGRILGVVIVLLGVGAQAQETVAPEVIFVSPQENAIVQDSLSIVVEGLNFQDIKTFGFANFFYEDGANNIFIGVDDNTFDGLSFVWDTTTVPDGEYRLTVEVADLFNNKGSAKTTIFVNNNGNQSFTNRVTQNLINAVESLARALDLPDDIELTNAIGIIQANLEIAVATIHTSLTATQRIVEAAPTVVAETDPFLRNTTLLRQLSRAISDAQSSILGLNLSAAKAALQDVAVAVRGFAQTTPNGVDLSPLNDVANGVEAAALQLDKLLEAIQGNSNEAVDEALKAFVALSQQTVPQLQVVADALRDANQDCLVSFSGSLDPIAVSFKRSDEARLIQVQGEQTSGQIEIVNDRGKLLLAAEFEQAFTWDGKTANGTAVNDGNFFFIITLPNGRFDVIKTGRIVVLP